MENIKLWESATPYFDKSFGQEEPTLTPYLLPNEKDENGDTKKRGCVIVCPGGAYKMRAEHEGIDISLMFNKAGISSFVLNYRLQPYDGKSSLADVQRAIRLVRYNSDKFGIDENKIAVIGFSAGGHLATMASTHYDAGLPDGDEIDKVSCRPNAGILCYAVISLTHDLCDGWTRRIFLGEDKFDDENAALFYSGEHSIKDDCPPIFMWHCVDDSVVSVKNTLNMARALRAKNLPFECHLYPFGGHGTGLALKVPYAKKWSSLACDWLKRRGF